MALSEYLDQCWLLVNKVMWHLPEINFIVGAQAPALYDEFENCTYSHIPQGQRVKSTCKPVDAHSTSVKPTSSMKKDFNYLDHLSVAEEITNGIMCFIPSKPIQFARATIYNKRQRKYVLHGWLGIVQCNVTCIRCNFYMKRTSVVSVNANRWHSARLR